MSLDQLAALKMQGVDLADIYKLGQPDMQVTNGYAYNKNSLQPGYMPSLQTTPDGKSVMTQIGQDGRPVISVPQGALGAFTAFQGAQNRSQADWTPQEVYAPDGSKVIKPRSAVLGGAPQGYATEPQMRASAAASMGNGAQAYDKDIADIQKALSTPGLDAGSRQMLSQELQNRQRQRAQYFPQAEAGNVVELSPAQQAANEAARVRVVEGAKSDVKRTNDARDATPKFNQILGTIDQVLGHPGLSTATGLSGAIDPRNYVPGTDARDFQAKAAQLQGQVFLGAYESLKGGGQITEVEGRKAENALASMDRAQSTEQYKKSLQEFKSVIEGALGRAQQATGQPPAQAAQQKAPTYTSAAAAIKDAQNAIMRGADRSKVAARLREMGYELPGSGATGGW